MDPTECLHRIRAITVTLEQSRSLSIDRRAELGIELAETFKDLDEWLAKGGFVPNQWKPRPPAAPHTGA